jgi:hypothetical protein
MNLITKNHFQHSIPVLIVLVGLLAPASPPTHAQTPQASGESPAPAASPPAQAAPQPLPPEAALHARRQCLILAKAFEQERFRIRDSHWDVTLRPNESQILRLNLLGNLRYWFCAGSNIPDSSPRLQMFDEDGLPLPPETVSSTGIATGFMIDTPYTGSYYIKITNRGDETAAVSLMYCYK